MMCCCCGHNRNKYDMVEYTHRIRMVEKKKGIFFRFPDWQILIILLHKKYTFQYTNK